MAPHIKRRQETRKHKACLMTKKLPKTTADEPKLVSETPSPTDVTKRDLRQLANTAGV